MRDAACARCAACRSHRAIEQVERIHVLKHQRFWMWLCVALGGPSASPASPYGGRHRRAGPRFLVYPGRCLSQATSAPCAPEHPCAQVSPARGESRTAARRSGRRALAGTDHIGMEVLLRLRQLRQKKAEVHAESPRVSRSCGRLGEESQQTRLRDANSARYSGFKSARFPQGTKKGSGITDNCHCRTSELLIVTAARGEPDRPRHAQRKWRSAHRTASASDARNERTVPRARFAHGAISARCCARKNTRRRRVDANQSARGLLLDAHHLPGWQDGG